MKGCKASQVTLHSALCTGALIKRSVQQLQGLFDAYLGQGLGFARDGRVFESRKVLRRAEGEHDEGISTCTGESGFVKRLRKLFKVGYQPSRGVSKNAIVQCPLLSAH